jgi:hypothetical protein
MHFSFLGEQGIAVIWVSRVAGSEEGETIYNYII